MLYWLNYTSFVHSASISFERLNFTRLWQTLGSAAGSCPNILSQNDFFNAFTAGSRTRSVILLIDEFDKLFSAPDDIRDEFLQTLREFKNDKHAYDIHGIIVAGTFDILHLSTTHHSLSPFNVADVIQTPYFTVEETRTLFHMFAQDYSIDIDDDVIKDVWAKSNGYIVQFDGLSLTTHCSCSHRGMVGVCGRAISNRLGSLLDHDSRTLPFRNWDAFPVQVLYMATSLRTTPSAPSSTPFVIPEPSLLYSSSDPGLLVFWTT